MTFKVEDQELNSFCFKDDIYSIEEAIVIKPEKVFKNEKFVFSDEVKKLRIDVGLAGGGSYGCRWLVNNEDVGVIGIEANYRCIDSLIYGLSDNSYEINLFLFRNKIVKFIGFVSEVYYKKYLIGLDMSTTESANIFPCSEIVLNGRKAIIGPHIAYSPLSWHPNNFRMLPVLKEIRDIGGKYILLGGAVDNVGKEIKYQNFYLTPKDYGTSSLRREVIDNFPEKGGYSIERVPSYSLESILDHVDWDRFPFIECVKIDVEAKELDVLKSCGHYIDKVVYFRVEAFEQEDESLCTHGDDKKIIDFLEQHGFHLFDKTPGDFKFVNKRYLHLAGPEREGLVYY
jgi:hypothetical protein